jgi:hypothetical protein
VSEQGDLFEPGPFDIGSELYRAFLTFYRANPTVYTELVALARQAKAAGHERYSIAALFELVRWHRTVEVRSSDGFKLNNNHRAFYAREIMEREPDLAGFFATREQTAA